MKLLMSLMLLVCVYAGNAQTLRALVFTNTNDKTIGNSAKKNTGNISDIVKDIAEKLDYKLELNVFSGSAYTHENLDSVLTNLRVDSGDVVFFYINTHGYKSSTVSDFPRLSISSERFPKHYLVSADTINQRLLGKAAEAASVLTITQSCNRVKSRSPDLPIGEIAITDFSKENYRSLFLSGLNVMVTSSQRGKTSIATPKGSHFTLSFIKALSEEAALQKPGSVKWEQVLKKATRYGRLLNRSRYPVWKINPL